MVSYSNIFHSFKEKGKGKNNEFIIIKKLFYAKWIPTVFILMLFYEEI